MNKLKHASVMSLLTLSPRLRKIIGPIPGRDDPKTII